MEELIERKLMKKEDTEKQVMSVSVNDFIISESDDFGSQDCYDTEDKIDSDIEEEKHALSEQFRKQSDNNIISENGDSDMKKEECDFDKLEVDVNINSELCNEESAVKKHALHHIEEDTNKADAIKFNIDTNCRSNQCRLNVSDQSSESHMETFKVEEPYKYGVCNFSCTLYSELVGHMRAHTGEKPYKCNICSYSFSQPSELVKHMRTHTGEKPYKCNVCNYSCIRSNDLVRHMRTHTGEKPYICDVCNYSCSIASNLAKHLRRHTGEKPYKCNECYYSSSYSRNLKRHMSKHTRAKQENVISAPPINTNSYLTRN